MYRVEQVGGLAVAFAETDRATIERELKRLDPNLFLDFQTNGRFVWPVVMEWVGDRHVPPAIPVLDWRDASGPRPLTLAVVEQVKRLERRDDRLLDRIREANEKHERQARLDGDAAYDDVTRDFHRHAKIGHFSGPVPRSRALQLARQRARGKGRSGG